MIEATVITSFGLNPDGEPPRVTPPTHYIAEDCRPKLLATLEYMRDAYIWSDERFAPHLIYRESLRWEDDGGR